MMNYPRSNESNALREVTDMIAEAGCDFKDNGAAFQKLAKARKSGDGEACESIVKGIALANARLIVAPAKKICAMLAERGENGFDERDLIQAAYASLEKAVQNFDFTAKCKFSTFASTIVWRDLQEVSGLRRLKSRKGLRFLSKDAPISSVDGDIALADTLKDEGPQPSDGLCDNELSYWLDKTLREVLTPRERDCLLSSLGYYRAKEKNIDVAKRHGISGARVGQIVKDALRKLQGNPILREIWGMAA